MLQLKLLKYAILVMNIITFFCCFNYKGKDILSTSYSKIEIYCYCFSSEKGKLNNDGTVTLLDAPYCQSIIPTTPETLVNERYFLDSTSNASVIDSIQSLIFNKKENSEKISPDMIDARIVILFKKNDIESDIVTYSASGKLFHKNYLFTYSFDIIDSIQKILKKDKIDCKSN